jgi:hypothetical protein
VAKADAQDVDGMVPVARAPTTIAPSRVKSPDDQGQKENVNQQLLRAAAQPSKRGTMVRSLEKDSGSDHDSERKLSTDSEYPQSRSVSRGTSEHPLQGHMIRLT